ncbi:hypothetical protein V8F20_000122 [Naviculisporaceae sp. PSN 640]
MLANCWAFNLGETNVIILAQLRAVLSFSPCPLPTPPLTHPFSVGSLPSGLWSSPKWAAGYQSGRAVQQYSTPQRARCVCRKRAITESVLYEVQCVGSVSFWRYSGCWFWSIIGFKSIIHHRARCVHHIMKIMMPKAIVNRDAKEPILDSTKIRSPETWTHQQPTVLFLLPALPDDHSPDPTAEPEIILLPNPYFFCPESQ